jgi:hypothetical protein
MIKRIIIGIVALLIVAAGVFGVRYWLDKQAEVKPPEAEKEIALGDTALGEIPETTESEADVVPDIPGGETSSMDTPPPSETDIPIEEGPVDLSEDIPIPSEEPAQARSLAQTTTSQTGGPGRETRPVTTEQARSEEQPTEITVEELDESSEPTPIPTTPVVTIEETPTPVPTTVQATPTPSTTPPTTPVVTTPVAGNYSVQTLMPVPKSQLTAVRKTMQSLGVSLKEQATGQQQRLQAYRVAVGFFRSQQEAKAWANDNFRPKGIKYYVYPVQGMYSIQVGVYTQQRNIELAMRELHSKFPGWRLPVRTEMATITRSLYHLSIRGITENLAKKVWDALTRLGIQAELAGV